MVIPIALLLLSIFFIVIASETFTNSLEYIGFKLNLSQAVIGSILAAIGTALPETILPVIAILFLKHSAHEIGIGAILGAPFMLSTLGFFMVGIGVTIRYFFKKGTFNVNIEKKTTKRDLIFFLISYTLAIATTQLTNLKHLMALVIILIYILYMYLTFKGRSSKLEFEDKLSFSKYLKLKENLFVGFFQLFFSLSVMIFGAYAFVNQLSTLSQHFGFNPLIFSLLISPIATELPEKINSLTWTLKNKDILAFGNISGAMVFQSSFPVSIGILLTEWTITQSALLSAYIALFNIALMLFWTYAFKKLNGFIFSINLFTYIYYLLKII
ncbi:Sodium/calcium exchanger membrane region [Desulfurella amilsii]|uniref:Sodium/calcium exchanger membrane region n=1 Tax=Desulfurella amilsii TaxID=1562698 RepID=A0A1X4Y064_9BACT|nr:sodium:calcium antiporter [Desulfurella amilsii]OSS43154.1 Sodium/calcium exchanger membrane region [Desulfurella amilsii]